MEEDSFAFEEKRRKTIERNKAKMMELTAKARATLDESGLDGAAAAAGGGNKLGKRKGKDSSAVGRQTAEAAAPAPRRNARGARKASESARARLKKYNESDPEETQEDEESRSASSYDGEEEGLTESDSDSTSSTVASESEGKENASTKSENANTISLSIVQEHLGKKKKSKKALGRVEKNVFGRLSSTEVKCLFDDLGGGKKGGITRNDLEVVFKALDFPHTEDTASEMMERALDSRRGANAAGQMHPDRLDYETFSSLVSQL
ncbi:hypothetical protein A3770_10p60580 [Chloropicon primus]|uniref:EF-hand domain-containing protein n=1 Tax=Chloropicon primus TaxID=1764295 RepID=A0A5B8MVQ6_9CHLO|nr:hypothetical protein A3770_10p60580 [Chloropicon primus]|mmetsp:Transcript_5771/g.17441  ORF Transcript_5771/g.17441 Transcript_5771/m.17441 type:complete len:264 (-) Transcript_5771:61-852(-)|eukprot:QDZ23540.1 hypothetical protein A3770_10p60580 [Chloropicon primus]